MRFRKTDSENIQVVADFHFAGRGQAGPRIRKNNETKRLKIKIKNEKSFRGNTTDVSFYFILFSCVLGAGVFRTVVREIFKRCFVFEVVLKFFQRKCCVVGFFCR